MEKSAFTLYKDLPMVRSAVTHYSETSLAELYEKSLQGDRHALRALLVRCLPYVVRGFQKPLQGHPVSDQIQRSHEFFNKFLKSLVPAEGTGILRAFTPSQYNGRGFQSMEDAFLHYIEDTVEKMAGDSHNREDTGITGSPEEDDRNTQLNKEFLDFLRNHNSQYARVYSDMMSGKGVKEILDSYAWKSPSSLGNKIDIMKELYGDFLKVTE